MNQRIEKLAREAALAEGWGPGVWQTTFTEKFAELIVRECADIVENQGRFLKYDRLADKLKSTFGIE